MKEQRPPTFTQNTRLLVILIGLASTALVTAAVVLMMLKAPGDFSTVPRITKVTSASSQPGTETPSPAPTTAATDSSTSATSSAPSSGAEERPSESQTASPSESPARRPATASFHPTPGVG
ncbi:MAG: hypothetical protein ACOYB7_00575 [Mycobacterium sp.]